MSFLNATSANLPNSTCLSANDPSTGCCPGPFRESIYLGVYNNSLPVCGFTGNASLSAFSQCCANPPNWQHLPNDPCYWFCEVPKDQFAASVNNHTLLSCFTNVQSMVRNKKNGTQEVSGLFCDPAGSGIKASGAGGAIKTQYVNALIFGSLLVATFML